MTIQCVLLDPNGMSASVKSAFQKHRTKRFTSLTDAIPLRQMNLNKVPFDPNDEPLLGILDKFQEGRSHMDCQPFQCC